MSKSKYTLQGNDFVKSESQLLECNLGKSITVAGIYCTYVQWLLMYWGSESKSTSKKNVKSSQVWLLRNCLFLIYAAFDLHKDRISHS